MDTSLDSQFHTFCKWLRTWNFPEDWGRHLWKEVFWVQEEKPLKKDRWAPIIPSAAVSTILNTADQRKGLFCGETSPSCTDRHDGAWIFRLMHLSLNMLTCCFSKSVNVLFPLQYENHRSLQATGVHSQWAQWQWRRGGQHVWGTGCRKDTTSEQPEEQWTPVSRDKRPPWAGRQARIRQSVTGFYKHERPGWQGHRGETYITYITCGLHWKKRE